MSVTIREYHPTCDFVSKSKEIIPLTEADILTLFRWKNHLISHCNSQGIKHETAARFRAHIQEIEEWLKPYKTHRIFNQ